MPIDLVSDTLPPATARKREQQRLRETLRDARAGQVEAQYQLGLMHANGAGVPRDMGEAMAWIGRAAGRGHAGAQYMMSLLLVPETGGTAAPAAAADLLQAFDWLHRAARQGHAKAMHRLARLISQHHGALSNAFERNAADMGVAESQTALALAGDGAEALGLLQRAAEQGQPEAQTRLGRALLHGSHGRRDPDAGLAWLHRAAERGWPPALRLLLEAGEPVPALRPPTPDPVDGEARLDLGWLWEHGHAGLPAHRHEAAQWYALAASQGVAAAHAALGRLALDQVPTDALAHFRAGAEAGDPPAQHALSIQLGALERPASDRLDALAWQARAAAAGHAAALLRWADSLRGSAPELADEALRRAAAAGDAEAQARWGDRLLARPDTAAREAGFDTCRRAATQGHAGALGAIGMALLNGTGVRADAAAGVECLTQAAERGDPRARWNLALLHAGGLHGLRRDPALAIALCSEAAERDFVPAQATLGVLCAAAGRHDEALRWWQRAAEAGDLEATYNLAQAVAGGKGAPRDPARAFALYLDAAEAGLARAQSRVGVLYASGEGVAADPIEAHKWFFLARLAGDADGRANCERSRGLLDAASRDEAERRARRWRDIRTPR